MTKFFLEKRIELYQSKKYLFKNRLQKISDQSTKSTILLFWLLNEIALLGI